MDVDGECLAAKGQKPARSNWEGPEVQGDGQGFISVVGCKG